MSPPVRLHHIASGAGPPLLLLHGLFDSLETWEAVVPTLSGHFRVYAVDLPGFGSSPLPPDWRESLSGMIDSVTAFLHEQNIAQISLVGNSMGGSLALALAQAYPKRVHKLVLLNPYGLPKIPQAVENARRPIVGKILPYVLAAPVMKRCIKGIFLRSLHNQALLTPTRISRVAKPFSSLRQRQNLFRFLRAISPEKILEIDAGLSKIRQSVLILWGKEDRWLTKAHCQHLSQGLSAAEILEIDACGHLPQIEKPETVAAAVISFLLQENRGKSTP